VIHIYRPDQTPDEVHGAAPIAIMNGTTITYSHLMGIVDKNIIVGDVSTASGMFEFTRSRLMFHKRSSEPFTVTYSIDATLRSLSRCRKSLRTCSIRRKGLTQGTNQSI
jgi:hypothetical protein